MSTTLEEDPRATQHAERSPWARLSPAVKTMLGLAWLALKLLAVLLLSNGAAAKFVYQNF